MKMEKGIISAEEWAKGKSSVGNVEKASAVLEVLKEVGKGGANMGAIGRSSGLKWPYSTVQALRKSGTLERKKIGKAYFYRIK